MKVMLTGNEALARGAYEYGVKVAMGYPGTPSSEILENVARYKEIYSEWSINEKVAMDGVMGAAYAGRRAMFTTKQVGMNVASDSFMYGVYTGANAGVLIVTADDPGMFSSQNEQDNRHYARLSKMPMLEPSDSQDAKDFVGAGLEISERFDLPVILRTVMRVSHSSSPVELGERCCDDAPSIAHMKRDPRKFVATAGWARLRRPMIEERIGKLAEFAETFPYNKIEWGDRSLGIITGGVVYQYAREIFPNASFLKLGMLWPLPPRLVAEFAAGVERVIVIEELDPFLEEQVRLLGVRAEGKTIFPAYGELLPATIERCAITAGLLPERADAAQRGVTPQDLPPRSPVLCPGCPHRSTFYTLNKLKYLVAGDIGCYNLGALPPFNATDTMGAMGASVGVAHGWDKAGLGDPAVAVIGDGTFFHSGMAPLLNMVHNNGKGTIVILDNRTTAMTGHQDHPGVSKTLDGDEGKKTDIADLCRAMGVEYVRKIDAFDMKAVEQGFKEAVARDDLSVLVLDGPCVFVELERKAPFEVDASLCNGCTLCLRLGCPAIFRTEELDEKTGRPKVDIDPVLCVSCDMCRQICPRKAIFMPTEAFAPVGAIEEVTMKPYNFLVTGVGGQGTVVASDILAAVGLAAGYDVKKSDVLGLSVRGGSVVSHIRWGDAVRSPIVPEGKVDVLVAFEILEALRWLDQVRPDGTILVNQQRIYPVMVSSGLAEYPADALGEAALLRAAHEVYRVPGLDIAQALGNTRALNVVLLGALSGLTDIDAQVWVTVVRQRVPAKVAELNVNAFWQGRSALASSRLMPGAGQTAVAPEEVAA